MKINKIPSFQEWSSTFNDIILFREIAELMNTDSNIKFVSNGSRLIQAISQEFGPIVSFTHDWNLNSKKYPRGVSDDDTIGFDVSLSNELTGHAQHGDTFGKNLDKIVPKLPELSKQIAGAIGKFLVLKKPGTLTFNQLYDNINNIKDLHVPGGMIGRFKLMLQKAIQLSINNANSQNDPNQSYAMLGDHVVRKDAVQQKAASNDSYINNMKRNMQNHSSSMGDAMDAKQSMRKQTIARHQNIDDLWNSAQPQPKQVPEPAPQIPEPAPQIPEPAPQIPVANPPQPPQKKSWFNR